MPRIRPGTNRTYSLLGSAHWVFLIISVVCFGMSAWVWLDARLHQAESEEIFSQTSQPATSPEPLTPGKQQPIAKLEIARLGVHGYVEVGVDATTLRRSIGLSPLGARPGEEGNVILAAHRDTFFAGLKRAKTGDLIELQSRDGRNFRYRITRLFVVNPRETWVMRSSPGRNMLTLITCYPFRFAGSAPQRFVVQALPLDGAGTVEPSSVASI